MNAAGELGPFRPSEWEEVHLSEAPLIRVLAQVRWDELTQFTNGFESKAAEIANLIEPDFPISNQVQEVQFEIGPNGVVQKPVGSIHRFASADDKLRFYFAPTFATLETSDYTSRDDFCSRFEQLLQKVVEVARIPRAVRVGFRYVNRIADPADMDELTRLINPTLLGGKNLPGLDDVHVQHTLSETLYATMKGNLLAKWAVMPPGTSIDPTIEPAGSTSWVLDLDAYSEAKQGFDPKTLANSARDLSSLGYGFFRWAVEDAFLERFGGGRK